MAGLLDQYQLAGKTQALKMVTWMADYFGNRVAKVISQYTIERHWKIINTESGGMNDVFYRLYGITVKLFATASSFTHQMTCQYYNNMTLIYKSFHVLLRLCSIIQL